MSSIQSPGRRSVSAFFDSRTDAEGAAERIRAEGVPDGDIRIVAGESDAPAATTADAADGRAEKKSFWESLSDFFLPNEDRYAYAEGLSRGGYLVSVATNESNHARILDILDDEGTVDMDAREASWRSEGWQGYEPDRQDIGTEAFGRPATAGGAAVSDAADTTRDAAATGLAGAERFGRRDTADNRARVRSYLTDNDDAGQAGLSEPSAADRAELGSGLGERTDVELEDERRETADEVARRTRGAI